MIASETAYQVLAASAKATPGPWEAFDSTVGAIAADPSPGCGGCSGLDYPMHHPNCYDREVAGAAPADALFIALTRTAAPQLARRVLELEAQLAGRPAVIPTEQELIEISRAHQASTPAFEITEVLPVCLPDAGR